MKVAGISQSMTRFFQGVKAKWEELLPIVIKVAKKALIALAGAALFATNPTIFSIGLIIGIIWDKKTQEVVDKVVRIFKQQTLLSGITLAVGSVLSLHITWAAASLLYASHLGSHLAKEQGTPDAGFSLF